MTFKIHKGVFVTAAAVLQIIALVFMLVGVSIPEWMTNGSIRAGLFQKCDSKAPPLVMECEDAMSNNMIGGAQLCVKIQLSLCLLLVGFTCFFGMLYFAAKHQLFLSPMFLQILHFAAIVMSYLSVVCGIIGATLATYCMKDMMEPMGFETGPAMVLYWMNLPFSAASMFLLILCQLMGNLPYEESRDLQPAMEMKK